jgi:hypothetical protein
MSAASADKSKQDSLIALLPVELKLEILLKINSFNSLYALIRTCKSIYNVFYTYKEEITTAVFRNSMIVPHIHQARIIDSIESSVHNNLSPDFENTVQEAIDLEEDLSKYGTHIFQVCVQLQMSSESLIQKMCEYWSRSLPLLGLKKLPLTKGENSRLRAACVRFSMLQLMAGLREQSSEAFDEREMERLVSGFSMWEVEEICNIYFSLEENEKSPTIIEWYDKIQCILSKCC